MKQTRLGPFLSIFAILTVLSVRGVSEETNMEKMETSKNKTIDTVKEGYRNTKDKTCEMLNGKMECVENKMKNKVQTLKDKTSTKANELKNKVDND